MSLLTAPTPLVVRASSAALAIPARLLTNPVSWTVSLKGSTLISADFSVGSLKIAALTLVVIMVSSTYSSVLSRVVVPAQPSRAASSSTAMKPRIASRDVVVEALYPWTSVAGSARDRVFLASRADFVRCSP